MPNYESTQALAFVWRPGDLANIDVRRLAEQGVGTIVDLTWDHGRDEPATLQRAHVASIKITLEQFMEHTLEDFLSASKVTTLWVEFHPALTQVSSADFTRRMAALAKQCRVVPITGDPELIEQLLTAETRPATFALKGVEAGGWVGRETLSTLYATVEARLAEQSDPPALAVWGGVATPEAAAGFGACGAGCVVFESLHWLCDEAKASGDLGKRLSNLRLDHTRVAGKRLATPYRVFDKGNSLAARELDVVTDQDAFVRQVRAQAMHPLESRLDRSELFPLGPEASFASDFAERFGSSAQRALPAFADATARLVNQAPDALTGLTNTPTAQALGTDFAVIQGGMSWISDKPAFAKAVARAGGLPTIALGLMDEHGLQSELSGLAEEMAPHPYALNVITLDENPNRDAQLEFIRTTKPDFAVIAAGEPAAGAALAEQGIEVIYLAPEPGLLRLALQAGIKWIVLEGFEAGGHVGAHSTMTLAQAALHMKRGEPHLFRDVHLVLAGGVFNRPTALRAVMLGADAVQMGTAYLATQEIVESGALAPLYQSMILNARPGATEVTGESIGLRVRALASPKIKAIRDLESRWEAGQLSEGELRQRLEQLGASSLLVAARGVAAPGGEELDADTCRDEGQFMSGAAAGAIGKVYTIKELHRQIAEGDLALTAMDRPRSLAHAKRAPSRGPAAPERIAITGLAISNALGNGPAEVWQACIAGTSGICEVPASRWDHSRIYHPTPLTPEKTYCKVGAFADLEISRRDLGLPPQDFRTMTASTRLTMWLAKRALEDSGLLESDIDRNRVGVMISQNSGEAASTLREMLLHFSADSIVEDLRGVLGLSPEQAAAAIQAIKSGKMAVDDTTLLGRLNCAAGGFICNKYGFRGASYSVSAACATSLVALYNAVNLVGAGVLDAVLVGGGEEPLNQAHYLEFGALGALAGLSANGGEQLSRPFDRMRDGMVLGEGGGMILVERESLAKERGALVHAYITGMGASNNDQGMVESLAETQELAIGASFDSAGYGPETVDLVECHATSTSQGDVQEVVALKAFYPQGGRTVLTSFKSQIGHTLGASGINSLIRAVCACQAGVLPGTLNYREPDPEMDLEGWGFRVPTSAEQWPGGNGRPRRLQVNAFGFGGANYVVQVEECPEAQGRMSASVAAQPPAGEAAVVGEPLAGPLLEQIHLYATALNHEPHRLAVPAEDAGQAGAKLDEIEAPPQGLDARTSRAWARAGVYAAPMADASPPVAFVFAGQGSQYRSMSRELYQTFAAIRATMDQIAEVAEFDILDLLFNSAEEDLQKTRWQQPALFTMEYAMVSHLMSLGMEPTAMAGHSLGELVALCVAGVFSPADGFRLVNQRALCMDKASTMAVDPGAMIAVDAPLEMLEEIVAEGEGLYFTNYNSPRQMVIGGDTETALAFKERMEAAGYWTARLKVSMAFHSPIMKVIRTEMQAFIDTLEFHSPRIPVVSNTTRLDFPDDPAEIKRIVMAHLEAPVHWMQNVATLWESHGCRAFVEIGPKDSISNLIQDSQRRALTSHTCHPDGEAEAFLAATARLWSLGHIPVQGRLAEVELKPGRPKEEVAREILSREINAFVAAGLEGDLAANLLQSLQQDLDPNLKEEDLGLLLSGGLSLNLPPRKDTPVETAGPGGDVLEQVIELLMAATGYERDEIEPDMEIRADLSIRSSRLPVIMNAAEQAFGITIRLEDFIEVRTVRDLADRVALVIERDGATAPQGGGDFAMEVMKDRTPKPRPKSDAPAEPIERLGFAPRPMEPGLAEPLVLDKSSRVALVCAEGSALGSEVARRLDDQLAAKVITLEVLSDQDAMAQALARLAEVDNLAGLVLVLDDAATAEGSASEAAGLLTGYFGLLKTLMRSDQRRLVLAVSQGDSAQVAAQGVLGMHLAVSHEYSSVLWRSLELGEEADPASALKSALDTKVKEIELKATAKGLHTMAVVKRPMELPDEPALAMGPGHVVAISGGAKGIGAYVARALAVSGCSLALLGRTKLDPEEDYARLLELEDKGRDLSDRAAELEVARALAELKAMGAQAAYYSCDAADTGQAAEALKQAAEELGPVTGLVHGAGLLADSYLEFMDAADFAKVVEVKLLGAANLIKAAGPGLRWAMALSSVAAVTGNPGQANYCAANRAMAALVSRAAAQSGFAGRVYWLPPIEGAGMADDPELRELMALRGMDQAFLQAQEVARWLARDLAMGPSHDEWVLPSRYLPGVEQVRMEMEPVPDDSTTQQAAGLVLGPSDLPMIDELDSFDLAGGELHAHRIFTSARDLWLDDHRPFEFLRHPIVSGVMAVETMLESGRLLMPHLHPTGVEQVRYQDILEVPEGIQRRADVRCGLIQESAAGAVCEVEISSAFISPTGRELDTRSANYSGRVVLSASPQPLDQMPGLAMIAQDFDTRPMDAEEVAERYVKRTTMAGRYRVVHSMEGTGEGVVSGDMFYSEADDLAEQKGTPYLYPVYVLEGLSQLVNFYLLMKEDEDSPLMIPAGLASMRYSGEVAGGQRLRLEARRTAQDAEGYTWDARALDENGQAVMVVKGLELKWYQG